MPKFHENAQLLASALAKAFQDEGRSRTDAARIAGVSDETIRRWLLGEIPVVNKPQKLHAFDKAAGWKRGECRRILKEGVLATPPVGFLEVLTETLQAHLSFINTGLEINGKKITGDESREQLAQAVESAYAAALDQLRTQNAVSPPDRPDDPDDGDDESPRTPVSPGGFRLSGA
jgi:hypothetical protein